MSAKRLHVRVVALLLALGVGSVFGLRPSHADSETVTSGVRSQAVQPTLDLNHLALSGDFTIRYTVIDRDSRLIREPDVPQQSQMRRERFGSEVSDRTGRPMTLTLSQRGGAFLCQLMTNQPDPSTAREGDKAQSQVVLYDGKQSFVHVFGNPSSSSTIISQNTRVYEGLDGIDLSAMPVFSSNTSGLTLIKSLNPIGDGIYEGVVLDPGNAVGHALNFYDPTTLVHIAYAQGKPRVTQIIRRDSDGTVSRQMDVTEWALFRGVWIPAKASYAFTSFSAPGKRNPSHTIEWSLLDATATADARQFDFSTYLHAGDAVVTSGNSTEGSSQVNLTYKPTGGSLDHLRQDALAAQSQLTNRKDQFVRRVKADTTNHGDGQDANVLFSKAKSQAAASDRRVFLVFHASWCGPCFILHRFLTDPKVKPIIDAHFVVQELDIWEREKNGRENPGGAALDTEYGGPNSIPFFVLLNSKGNKLSDSIHNGANMGVPTRPEDVAFLMRSLKAAAPSLTVQELTALKAGLQRSTTL